MASRKELSLRTVQVLVLVFLVAGLIGLAVPEQAVMVAGAGCALVATILDFILQRRPDSADAEPGGDGTTPAKPLKGGTLARYVVCTFVAVGVTVHGLDEMGRWLAQPVVTWIPNPRLESMELGAAIFVALVAYVVLIGSFVRAASSAQARHRFPLGVRVTLVALAVSALFVRLQAGARLETHYEQALQQITVGMTRRQVEGILLATNMATTGYGREVVKTPRDAVGQANLQNLVAKHDQTTPFELRTCEFIPECFNWPKDKGAMADVDPHSSRYRRNLTISMDAFESYDLTCNFDDSGHLTHAQYAKTVKDYDLPENDKHEVLWTVPPVAK